jgi:hypothetical protein
MQVEGKDGIGVIITIWISKFRANGVSVKRL